MNMKKEILFKLKYKNANNIYSIKQKTECGK